MEKIVKVSLGRALEPGGIARFVQIANQYKSTIHIEMKNNLKVNVKSIMGMMNFMSEDGEEVTVRAEESDEERAAEAIAACLTGKE